MKRSELKSIIRGVLTSTAEKSKPKVTEGSGAPDKSIYGAIGKVAMPDLLSIMRKTVPSKYVKFGKVQGAGLGLWMIEFDGYTRSDMAITGWVSLTAPGGAIKGWSVDIDFTDAMKGNVRDSYSFMAHENWTTVFTNAAKRLKQWVEL